MRLWHRAFGGGPDERAAARLFLERERAVPVSVRSSPLVCAGAGSNGLPAAAPSSTLDGDTVIYRLVGDLTYISALQHVQRLRRLDSGKNLILSFRFCFYVDLDGLDALEECMLELAHSRPSRIILVSSIAPDGMAASLLHNSAWFQREFVARQRVFPLVQDAINWLRDQAMARQHVQGQARSRRAAGTGHECMVLPLLLCMARCTLAASCICLE